VKVAITVSPAPVTSATSSLQKWEDRSPVTAGRRHASLARVIRSDSVSFARSLARPLTIQSLPTGCRVFFHLASLGVAAVMARNCSMRWRESSVTEPCRCHVFANGLTSRVARHPRSRKQSASKTRQFDVWPVQVHGEDAIRTLGGLTIQTNNCLTGSMSESARIASW